MSSALITVVTIGIISLFAIWHTATNLNIAQVKRQEKLVKLKKLIAQLQRLHDRIPNNYLSKKVKLLLLNDLISNLKLYEKLDPKSLPLQENLQKRQEQKKQTESGDQKTKAADIKNPEEATEVRRRIMDLQKYVINAKKLRKIEKAEAVEEINNLKHLFITTATNSFINQAKSAERQKNAVLAIHYLNRATKEYEKANNNNQYKQNIAEINAKIAAIKATTPNNNKAKSNDNALTAAMDELLAEEETNKKMRF